MTLSDDKSVNAGLRSQRKILFDAIVFHCRSEILDFDTINQIWEKSLHDAHGLNYLITCILDDIFLSIVLVLQ